MPNWTTNTVTLQANPETLEEIKALMETEESVFDFNKLIPMPDELDMEYGSVTDEAIVMYASDNLTRKIDKNDEKWQLCYRIIGNQFSSDWPRDLYERLKKRSAKDLDGLYDKGRQYVENYKRYGTLTWHGWCCRYWGTKWNACDADIREDSDNCLIYRFDTAWAPPLPVLQKLAELYPRASIIHEYRNEDGYEVIYEDTYAKGRLIASTSEIDEEYLDEIS